MNRLKNSGSATAFSGKAKTIFFALLTLLVACFLTTAGRAQNSSPPANQTEANTSEPASPTPIPFSEVIAQSETASSTLKEIEAGAAAPATEAIERDLPVLTAEINARLKETAQMVEGATSLDDLRSFEADWRTLTRNLPEWSEDLTARAKKLEGDLLRLDELSERWRKTLEELEKTETPPEVLARVREILRVAAETRRLVTAQQARVAALQNRVAEQQNRAGEALKTISARRETLVGQLLVQDSPPIWRGELWTRGGASTGRGIRDSLSTQLQGLNAFASRNTDKLAIHLLVFFLLAGILFYLRRRARPLTQANPDLRQAAVIFYLPVSTALVLAIVFSSRIYPQTPQILGAIFGAIALVPTVIILRRLVERQLYPLLYSLVLFYFIDQLRAIFEGVPAITRPLFLTEMLGAFFFFWWLYSARLSGKEPPEEARAGRIFRVVRAAAVIVLPFFAASLLANFFGYLSLARLIGDGVLKSLYVAVVLYAAVRIVDGLIVFALRFRPLTLLKMARDYAPSIQEKAQKITRFAALLLWLSITLEFFTLREVVFRETLSLLTAKLNLGSLSISAADVLLFFLVVWAAFLLSRFIRFALEEDVFPRFSLAPGIPYAISMIINYLILLVGFFFAVGAAGLDLTRITVLVGAFGVGIGFGLQNIFNNFVSGLILLFERPVKVGDEIMIQEASGIVRRIGIRASIIRQWDNSEIIVPNSKLISENVKNWTRTKHLRGVEVPVRVAHGADTQLVIELLKQVAGEHPLVVETPAPQAMLSEFGELSLTFKVRAWTTQTDKALSIGSELALAISKTLDENNIAVPQFNPNLVS